MTDHCDNEIAYVRDGKILSRHVCELPPGHEKCHATAALSWPNLTVGAAQWR